MGDFDEMGTIIDAPLDSVWEHAESSRHGPPTLRARETLRPKGAPASRRWSRRNVTVTERGRPS